MHWYWWFLLYFVIGYMASIAAFATAKHTTGSINGDDRLVTGLIFMLWPLALCVVLATAPVRYLLSSPEKLGLMISAKLFEYKRKREEAKRAAKRAAELKALAVETENC